MLPGCRSVVTQAFCLIICIVFVWCSIPRQVFVLSFSGTFVSPRRSLSLSQVRQLSCTFTRVPQMFGCTFDQSSRVNDPDELPRFWRSIFLVDFRARGQHHCSSMKLPFDVWSCTLAFTASPEVRFVTRSEMCQWSVPRSRCSLESFFMACFQPRLSGCFHSLQIFQETRRRSFGATVEKCLVPIR